MVVMEILVGWGEGVQNRSLWGIGYEKLHMNPPHTIATISTRTMIGPSDYGTVTSAETPQIKNPPVPTF